MATHKRESRIPDICDFELARDELANFFRTANQDAAKEGATACYKQEFVAGWEQFKADPCEEVAAAWISSAKEYEHLLMTFFLGCSPGGQFYALRGQRNAVSDKPDDAQPIEEQVKHFRNAIDLVVKGVSPDQRAAEAFNLTILTAAHQCLKATEQFIQAYDSEVRSNKVFLVYCEFFCFFMHLASRSFYADHGERIRQTWQDELGPACVTAFLESRIGHWPQEMKDRIRSDVYSMINDAEMDYAECRGLYAQDNKLFTGNTLFSKLARNVAELAGTTNPAEQVMIIDGAVRVFVRLSFKDRVNELAAELKG